jgi:cobalt-precorrin-7 (C5)-methyltransferase
MKPNAYIIGVGPGASDLLSDRARDRIARSRVILGWDLDLLPAQHLLAGKEVHLQDVRNYQQLAKEVADNFRHTDAAVAILRIGDPCISSGLKGLLELFAGYEIEIVPGISSVQMAASLARIKIDEAVVVTFHESGDINERKRFMHDALSRGRHLLMLSGEELRPDAAARYLVERGIDECLQVLVCEKLTLPDQSVVWTTLGSLRQMQPHRLSVIAVVQPSTGIRESQGGHHANRIVAS